MKRVLTGAMIGMLLLTLAFCSEKAEVEEQAVDTTAVAATPEAATPEAATAPTEPEILVKPSGVRYQELVVGTGKDAVDQMQVECHYELWLADSTGQVKGNKVDSSKDRGQPFQCQLGVGLIPGWTDGMIGMKEGGSRRILVPWNLGYPNGAGQAIPAQTNLIFEIDFLKAL